MEFTELRSFNVERIYKETVKCVIGEELGTDKAALEKNTPAIRDMLSQIQTVNGYVHLCACNRRMDGEIWTPYLQIVEMLIRMGARIGCVKYHGELKPDTLIRIVGVYTPPEFTEFDDVGAKEVQGTTSFRHYVKRLVR